MASTGIRKSEYPHKTKPGFLHAFKVVASVGGWIALFDRRRGGLPEIPDPILATGRYIAIHEPSMNWVGYVRKVEAMAAILATVKGKDVLGILPIPVEKKEKTKAKATGAPVESPPPAPQAAIPPPILDKSSHAGAHAGERAQGTEGQGTPPPAPPPQKTNGDDAMAFHIAMMEEFTPEKIVDEIRGGLSAVKAFQTNSGDVHEVDDHATRVKYLDILIKYRIGMADKRKELKEPKKVTMGELQSIAKTPAGHRALQRMLDDAKAEMQQKVTPPAAPEVAKPS